MAKVVTPGKEPAVAIALASKEAGLQPLKCMVSVGLNALNAASQAGGDETSQAHKKIVARLDDARSTVERVSKMAADAKLVAKEAKAAAAAALAAAERSEIGVSHLNTRVHGLESEVRDNRQLLEDLQVERPISRRQYLWSCFCGLFSIKVTESSGPAHSMSGRGDKEARHEEELAGLMYEPSPLGPVEVEASCLSSCLSSSQGDFRISRNDFGLMQRKMMAWYYGVGEVVITDTTINLALTCILMRVSHAAGVNLSMKGVLHDAVESAIHLLTLAYFFLPFFALLARGSSFCRALKQRDGYKEYMCAGGKSAPPDISLLKKEVYAYQYVLNDAIDKAEEQTLSCSDVQTALDRLCPCTQLPKQKMNILFFWYAVAGYMAYSSIESNLVVAPFGYWYMIVQTLRMMYSVAFRKADVPQDSSSNRSGLPSA